MTISDKFNDDDIFVLALVCLSTMETCKNLFMRCYDFFAISFTSFFRQVWRHKSLIIK